MPRYVFHTADGWRARDKDGTELPDRQAARVEAIRYTGAVMLENPGVLWDGRDFRIEVTDETGTLLFTVIRGAGDASPAGQG